MKKFFITLIITVFVFPIFVYSQKKPKAELFDKFGDVTEEDYTVRLDGLLGQLLKTPKSKGYILIHDGKGTRGTMPGRMPGINFEQTSKGHIKFRQNYEDKCYGLDKLNIKFIRAENKENFEVNIWIVPEGAEKPNYIETKWDFTVSPNTKPFIFTTTELHYGGLSQYPEYLSLDHFAEYLEANTTSRGNFVVKTLSRNQYLEEKNNITRILKKYRISKNRINFFYIPVTKSSMKYSRDYYPFTEIWFLPKRIARK